MAVQIAQTGQHQQREHQHQPASSASASRGAGGRGRRLRLGGCFAHQPRQGGNAFGQVDGRRCGRGSLSLQLRQSGQSIHPVRCLPLEQFRLIFQQFGHIFVGLAALINQLAQVQHTMLGNRVQPVKHRSPLTVDLCGDLFRQLRAIQAVPD